VLLACLLAGSAAFAHEEQRIGRWVLKTGEERGPRSYCTVELVQDGRTLGYQRTKDAKAFFGLRDPEWRFEPRHPYEVRVSAGNAAWKGRAVAPLPDTLVLPVDLAGIDPAAAFAVVSSADVDVQGQSIRFDLSDFSKAAAAQRDCLAKAN
jgi:hypothetical protein